MCRLKQKHSSEHNRSNIAYGNFFTFFCLFDDTQLLGSYGAIWRNDTAKGKPNLIKYDIYWPLWGTIEIFPCKNEERMAVLYLDIKY